MGPESKTARLRRLVSKGHWREALKLAATFRRGLTREQQITLSRAHESYTYGYMQAQMKRDPEMCREAGIALLKELYGDGQANSVAA